MFELVEQQYEIFKEDRVNTPLGYFLHKIVELLGLKELLVFIYLPKK